MTLAHNSPDSNLTRRILPVIIRSTIGVIIVSARRYIDWASVLHRYVILLDPRKSEVGATEILIHFVDMSLSLDGR